MAVRPSAVPFRWRLFAVLIAGLLFSCAHKQAESPEIPSDPAGLLNYIARIRHSDRDLAGNLAGRYIRKHKTLTADRWLWRFRLLDAALILDRSGGSKDDVARVQELLRSPATADTPPGEAAARIALVRAFSAFRQNDLPGAVNFFDESLANFSSVTGDPCWRAELLLERAQTLRHLPQQRVVAAQSLEQARSETRACPDRYWETLIPFVQGNLYNDEFYYERAVDALQECFDLAHKYPAGAQLEGNALGNKSLAYFNLGDFDHALLTLDQVDRYFESRGPLNNKEKKDWGTHKGHRARNYFSLHRYDDAIVAYKEAIRLALEVHDKDFLPQWRAELTAVYIEKREYPLAKSLNAQALQEGDLKTEAHVVEAAELNAARLDRIENDLPSALEELDRIQQQLSSGKDDPKLIWQLQIERAQVLAGMKRVQEAQRAFESALTTAQQARASISADDYRLTYIVPLRGIYQSYVDFLAGQARPAEALRVAEMGRARLLAEKLHSSTIPEATADFARLARLKNAAILSYSTGPKRSYLWVTTAVGTRMFDLPPEAELTERIKRHNEPILEERSLAEDREGRALYDMLVRPAADFLPAGGNVIVIPDGPLADLNFETLIPPGATAHYWLDSAVITVGPSLALLLAEAQHPVRPKSVLAVGGAIQVDPALPPLGDKELLDMQEIYGPACTPLRGGNATPRGFLQAHPERYSLIHLSAHAIANQLSPFNSYLALSPDDGEYKLYARDLAKLRLTADLVTLSACQSAGSKNVPGEGLVGLAWAVLSSGAQSVVASLWPVPAAPTGVLMKRFYLHLHAGEAPDRALHAAKREIADAAGSRPYDWAAFQLYSR